MLTPTVPPARAADLRLTDRPAGPDRPHAAQVEAVADNFARLMRTFLRTKRRVLAASTPDVEWSSQVIVAQLVACGPLRASELAEQMLSDPSTVSRQVATLVADGLVERAADPADGRASLLVPTARGREVNDRYLAVRAAHFRRLLADWSEPDCAAFADYLARFAGSYDRLLHTLPAEGDRPATAVASPATREENS